MQFSVRHRVLVTLIAGLTALVAVPSSRAQEATDVLPSIAAADSLFHLGLVRFDDGRFEEARSLFRQAAEDFSMHVNTTAALLMMGKSAYRLGDYRAATRELRDFLRSYPTSRYGEEATLTIGLAEAIQNRDAPDTVRVGIVLSLDDDEVAESQALFNGIQLAVEDYNVAGLNDPVKMIFRDSGRSPSGAAEAVRQLAREEVDFIVGTLFSDQAIAAAEAAERSRTVFIAPLATDEAVSEGKRYAFQANPSIELRGRLMARFAINGLRLQSLGVIARHEASGISERLTDSFIQEASELGAQINLVSILPNDNAWVTLSQTLSADTLRQVEAVYVPVTGSQPQAVIGALLSSLDRLGVPVRLLGNSAWHQLPMVTDASRYTATYSNDFFLAESDPNLTIFESRYEKLTGEAPTRLAFSGYDVTHFMLKLVMRKDRQPLYEAVWFEPEYRGLASRIEFRGLNINQSLFFHRYRDGELRLIR